jgi:hypothetical protein
MSIFDDYGAPTFGLYDCKLAERLATNSYGTAVDVPSIQMMNVELEMQTGRVEGDDRRTALASRVIGGKARMRFVSVNFSILEVIFGITLTDSGTTPNQGQMLEIPAGDRLPYLGICGKALAEEGDGDLHVFIPMAKIMSNITIANLEFGQFATTEFEAEFISDATFSAMELIEHETAENVAIPPVQYA